jgi:hypothetical protein
MNGFRRAAKISKKRGAFILSQIQLIENSKRSLWWWKRASMVVKEGRSTIEHENPANLTVITPEEVRETLAELEEDDAGI